MLKVTFFLILLSFTFAVYASAVIRGVDPADYSRYDLSEFKCFGTPTSIPGTYVNDNYCDCEDGSDEPGTSACSVVDMEAKVFYCINLGHKSDRLYRSQVDDGICDCCDGSDEQKGVCADSCGVWAEKHAEEMKIREERRQAGLLAQETLIGEAKKKRVELENQLKELKEKSEKLDTELDNLALPKKIEEEKEKKEKEEIHAESLKAKERWEADKKLKDIEKEKTEKNEEGSAKCLLWTQTGGCKGEGPIEDNDKGCEDSIFSQVSGFCTCEGPQKHFFDCGHPELTCLNVCRNNGLPSTNDTETFKVDDGSSHHRPEANKARETYNHKQDEKVETERRVAFIENQLKEEYGPNNAFLPLHSRCYPINAGEYTYELCLFDKVVQKRIGSESILSTLGKWTGFAEQTYSSWGAGKDFSKMQYLDGDHCWSGPTRTTNVVVVCGPTNEVLDVQEPSMCTYTMRFQTPAVCE